MLANARSLRSAYEAGPIQLYKEGLSVRQGSWLMAERLGKTLRTDSGSEDEGVWVPWVLIAYRFLMTGVLGLGGEVSQGRSLLWSFPRPFVLEFGVCWWP